MRKWLELFMTFAILIFTLFSFGCAGTSTFTECEGPALSVNSNYMNNMRYQQMFGY